jgi:hypothetical protein
MSFPTRQAKQQHDNDYLKYLMLQMKNSDKIVAHNANSDLSFQDGQPMDPEAEPTDTRPLEEQLMDNIKQRKQAYKNASKLFNKDTSRIDKLMSYLEESELTNEFNHLFPKIWKELGVKHAFATVQQVINMMEALIESPETTVLDALGEAGNNMMNGFFGDQGMNVEGAPPDEENTYGNFGNYVDYLTNALVDRANANPNDEYAYDDLARDPADEEEEERENEWLGWILGGDNEYGTQVRGYEDGEDPADEETNEFDPGDRGYFGWGFKPKKQMTAKEKKLQLKLNTLLKKIK